MESDSEKYLLKLKNPSLRGFLFFTIYGIFFTMLNMYTIQRKIWFYIIYLIAMKQLEFERIQQMSPSSRIGRRTRKEQMVRDDLAKVLKTKKKKEEKWKHTTRLEKKQQKLETQKHDGEIACVSRALERGEFTVYDLKFLESLSYSNLSKVPMYNVHWMRGISHIEEDVRDCSRSYKYPIFPKYTFLYEICRDKPFIDEVIKSELKEKAKAEVWKMVCDEIANDTFFYERPRSFVEHIFEYIPQKVLANKLRWTGNAWTETNLDVLLQHIDWFTELDEDYKREIKREYNKERGIIDPLDVQEKEEEKQETEKVDEEDCWEKEWWDDALSAYMKSREKDVQAFIKYMEEKKKARRKFDDWLESVGWF